MSLFSNPKVIPFQAEYSWRSLVQNTIHKPHSVAWADVQNNLQGVQVFLHPNNQTATSSRELIFLIVQDHDMHQAGHQGKQYNFPLCQLLL